MVQNPAVVIGILGDHPQLRHLLEIELAEFAAARSNDKKLLLQHTPLNLSTAALLDR